MKIRFRIISLVVLLIVIGIVLARNTESNDNFMDDQMEALQAYILQRDAINPSISKVDVAWHVDHSLKTINRIYEELEKSNPEEYRYTFSFSRICIFAWGDFPRGVAEAPKVVRPPEAIVTDNLYLQWEEARQNLDKLKELDDRVHFKHPYFNIINKGQTKRFLWIHTGHHLKIIEDILAK
ncbi:MAG: DUF1569 domain-containing protein [Bacteroidota bacterium]